MLEKYLWKQLFHQRNWKATTDFSMHMLFIYLSWMFYCFYAFKSITHTNFTRAQRTCNSFHCLWALLQGSKVIWGDLSSCLKHSTHSAKNNHIRHFVNECLQNEQDKPLKYNSCFGATIWVYVVNFKSATGRKIFVCKDRAISQQPTLKSFLLLLIKVYYQNRTKKAPFSVVHNLIYCYFTTCPIFTKTSVIFSLAKNCQKADNYFNRYSISPLPGVLYNTFPKHSSEIYQDVYKKVTCRCWN